MSTRRERQRQATLDEIVVVARDLLARGEEVSLRAVSEPMGLTAPALYRYVDSVRGLEQLVAEAVTADVVAHLHGVVARYDVDDPAARLVAGATAFRAWALGRPAEFHLVFNPSADGEESKASAGFGMFFSELVQALYARAPFELPTAAELDPDFVTHAEAAFSAMVDGTFAGSPGLIWVMKKAWARLYGIVALEAFGHIDAELVTSGAMYAAIMRDAGAELGVADDWDRLLGIARDVAATP